MLQNACKTLCFKKNMVYKIIFDPYIVKLVVKHQIEHAKQNCVTNHCSHDVLTIELIINDIILLNL